MRSFISAAAAALLAASSSAAAAAPRPNIVWIMSDDLGWGEIGSFPSQSPHGRIATPNIDKLAHEGVMFTQAYAGYTVCGPSRTTFFTGRHSGQFKKYGYPGTALPVALNVTTTAQILQRAGYATGASGKIDPLVSPTTQGFDRFVGQISQVACHDMYPSQIDTQTGAADPTHIALPLNSENPRSRAACMADPSHYNYTIDLFQQDALSFLDTAAPASKATADSAGTPFFLYVSFTVPHVGGYTDTGHETGQPVPTDFQYTNPSWPEVERDHAASITYMDTYVGDLMRKLKALDVDDDTIVFFASDNGAHITCGHKIAFFNSTGGLNGHKRSLFEGGVRSPSIARWPGKIQPNRTSEFQWAFWDAMPTFAELAGVDAAALPKGIDGISIVPTLLGQAQPAHEYVYFTWKGTGSPGSADGAEAGRGRPSGYGVRQGNWKGLVPSCSDTQSLQPSKGDAATFQLYNLVADPFEKDDVSGAHADIVEKMIAFVMTKDLTCDCYQC